jgi:FlaA1/EpsC-like NDP-sugar epimerase
VDVKILNRLIKGRHRLLVLQLIDIVCMSAAYWMILLRLQRTTPQLSTGDLFLLYLCMLGSVFFMRIIHGMHRQVWRYAEAGAYLRLVLADAMGGVLYFGVDRLILSQHMPISNAIAAVSTGLLLTLCSRFFYQVVRRRPDLLGLGKAPGRKLIASPNKVNVAIVGAGEVGVLLVRELLANRTSRYFPYCFFDNDPRKIGTIIEGIPVYGPDADIVSKVNSMPIQEIVIALPNVSPEVQKQVFDTYKNTNCKVMLYDYKLGKGEEERPSIREINIEDLLFRDVVSLEDCEIQRHYSGKVILVTGAGGSIGGELCRQLANMSPAKLVMLDIYENGVYDIQQELKRRYGTDLVTTTVIANISDKQQMDEVFQSERPDIVFHAAAHKHVPLMEHNCAEAVRNNVFGTYNVVNAAEHAGVKRFVMISTDKAVNPTNIMGATKRMCEIIIQSRKDSRTDFVAVRFGNVLGSNGSVVPLFKRQIAEGGPVTITDKRIIRYFMAIPEAAQLVLRTGCRGEKGELYVLDMGKPVRILDLAENMISLSGFVPYQDIDIQEIGLRPGEKLYEELLIKTDACTKTEDERIFIESDVPFERVFVDSMLNGLRRDLQADSSNQAVRSAMMNLLPTYQPADVVNLKAEEAVEFKTVAAHSYLDISVAPGIPS